MFNFLKSKKHEENQPTESKQSWFKKLRGGLKRTRSNLVENVASAVLGKKTIDDELLEELETILLTADVGVEASQEILDNITQQVKRKTLKDPQALMDALHQQLCDILMPCSKPLTLTDHPFTLLMVGINGSGKTTSIAKLAHYFQAQGKKVMLAAGDTFRAAAVEQLQVWGERNHVPVIAQHKGADSASVIFDATKAANAREYDLLIADTAGRLHTQTHLMDELAKIKRVMRKQNEKAPHETILVLDAGIGQNALAQAAEFHEAIGIDSLAITKLDGTAKGGIVVAIAKKMQLPIRFIGVGEQIDDLKPFDAKDFVDALFN
jgi:fused signal recognition particle receptor